VEKINRLMGTNFKEITKCVACDNSRLCLTLDLENQPLANDFLENPSHFETYPLKLLRCTNCSHSQISVAVDPSRLFLKYPYISGTSETLSNYFDTLVDKIIKEFGQKGKILDIGSNDGSFLFKFKHTNWSGLGVDPAINLISTSTEIGVITVPTFFNNKLSNLLSSNFDVIVAMNIFAHTHDPLDILLGIKQCLSENGKAYIQTSQADMFFSGQFDTVYHEHISFFNVKSMKALLKRAELYLNDVTIMPIHGGSYLWEITKTPSTMVTSKREVFEDEQLLYSDEIYIEFSKLAQNIALEVRQLIDDYRNKGFLIVSYGAAAKGNTFINFANLKLDYIFDDTPHKIGQHSPAGGCIVSNPALLRELNLPLLIIIPAWNFTREILVKIKELRTSIGDKYLTYFPEILLEDIHE
jgi:2-polyprenyl-3-methyl-5-hydroxy-6-metoxy-1,4-benzoquinol methylase